MNPLKQSQNKEPVPGTPQEPDMPRRDALVYSTLATGVTLLILYKLFRPNVPHRKRSESAPITEKTLETMDRTLDRYLTMQLIHEPIEDVHVEHCRMMIRLLETALSLRQTVDGQEAQIDPEQLLEMQGKLGGKDPLTFIRGMDEENAIKARGIIKKAEMFIGNEEWEPKPPKAQPEQRIEPPQPPPDGPSMFA